MREESYNEREKVTSEQDWAGEKWPWQREDVESRS